MMDAAVVQGWLPAGFNDAQSGVYKLYHDGVHCPNRRIVEHFYRYFGKDIKRVDKWEAELYG